MRSPWSIEAQRGKATPCFSRVPWTSASFWPWILALVGLTGALEEFAQGAVRAAVITLLMLGGLAVLFATGLF